MTDRVQHGDMTIRTEIASQELRPERVSANQEKECSEIRSDLIYVASRASVPQRSAMWRDCRDNHGWHINSSWIDEAGEGETEDFSELWVRITAEIAAAEKLVLYARAEDFPLKGALIEAGIALGMGKSVVLCLPFVELEPRSCRPIGSWINHPLCVRIDSLHDALNYRRSTSEVSA